MNIAHLAFYANHVLSDLNIETLPVAFWRGLYEGHGDTSLVPDYLIAAEKEKLHAKGKKVIAELNDKFRKSVLRSKLATGKAMMTAGIQALGNMAQAYIFQRVMNHQDFPAGNDPYGEHDFGVIEARDLPRIYWKIDYYEDASMEYGAEDKINCYRVLVIMLADEY